MNLGWSHVLQPFFACERGFPSEIVKVVNLRGQSNTGDKSWRGQLTRLLKTNFSRSFWPTMTCVVYNSSFRVLYQLTVGIDGVDVTCDSRGCHIHGVWKLPCVNAMSCKDGAFRVAFGRLFLLPRWRCYRDHEENGIKEDVEVVKDPTVALLYSKLIGSSFAILSELLSSINQLWILRFITWCQTLANI